MTPDPPPVSPKRTVQLGEERKAYYAKVLEDEAGFVRYDAVSRAGEDRAHLYGWRLNGTQVGLGYIRRRPNNTIELTEERAPTGAPAPCVWRPISAIHNEEWHRPDCTQALSESIHKVLMWRFCHYCGHPLTVER